MGCFTAGYYLFRWRTGRDIREHGSGNPGARNIGRLLGPGWFAVTLLLDAGKGALSVWLASRFGLGSLETVAAMLAVVTGHVWPIQLCFRGGKGVAASLGAGVVYTPTVAAIVVPVFIVLLVLSSNVTLAGSLAFVLAPGVALLNGEGGVVTGGLSILGAFVLFTNREDVRKEIGRRLAGTR
jgi:glycerol-3-phosphate acyltransferase PlsY